MSDTTLSLRQRSQTVLPDSAKPFPFLRLPAEIRNKIYENLLTDWQEPKDPTGPDIPVQFTWLNHNIQPQILQTCHQVYQEAKYIMMRKNLFVEVKFTIGRFFKYDFFKMLHMFRVPFIRTHSPNTEVLEKETDPEKRYPSLFKNFNGYAMRYEISTVPSSRWEEQHTHTMVLLPCHLDRFCAAIMQSQWCMSNMNEISNHQVTLLNPVLTGQQNSSLRLFSIEGLQKIQPMQLSPYFRMLRGVSKFSIIKDNNSDNEQHSFESAIANIEKPQIMTTKSVMKDLKQLKHLGDKSFHRISYGYAEAYYKLVDYKISVLMNKATRVVMNLFEAEGAILENELAEMYVGVCWSRARNAILDLEENIDYDFGTLIKKSELIYEMAAQARTPLHFSTGAYVPSDEVKANFFHLEAVAHRLTKSPESLIRAIRKVELGLELMPDYQKLIDEKKRIEADMLAARRLDWIRRKQTKAVGRRNSV